MRIASVPYLNAKPLIHGLTGVVLSHPVELALKLRGREVDVGLVPVMEVIEQGGVYEVVDGICISSQGPVKSVFLAHRKPLNDPELVVYTDQNSKTSAALVQIVCRKLLGINVPYAPLDLQKLANGEVDALMLIGDQALDFRLQYEGKGGWDFLDLGEVWTQKTGLPFVYALWASPKGVIDPDTCKLLRMAKEKGIEDLDTICSEQGGHLNFEERKKYLTENIRYDLGEMQKAGIAEFQKYLTEEKLINATRQLIYKND